MLTSKTRALALFTGISLFGACVYACSSDPNGGPIAGLDGGGGADAATDVLVHVDSAPPCDGAACVDVCEGGASTTLHGTVYDPANVDPLYGVLVYIPSGPLQALPEGPTCDACGEIMPAPVAKTKTDSKGNFELTGVPSGTSVPIVIQSGKWRRAMTVSVEKACAVNEVDDHTLRFPKNGTEGDMPQLAVTSGGCDALECLLRSVGVDQSEFVPGAGGAGHVHVFNGANGQYVGAPEAGGSAADPMGGELWNSAAKLGAFDTVLLSCECDESNANKGGDPGVPGARQAMVDYVNSGGRVIGSHYHYGWLKYSPSTEWQALANWTSTGTFPGTTFDVDTSTARGQALSEWLLAAQGSTTPGKVTLANVTGSLSAVAAPATSLINETSNGQPRVFSFSAPIGAPACGSFAFADLHMNLPPVSGGGTVFPAYCDSALDKSAAFKTLEFMLFELSACN